MRRELLTRWGRDLDPADVLPEHPRPQLARDSHLSLNGWWDHAFTPAADPPPTSYDGRILVPFSPEAPLSGVGRQLRRDERLTYRRHVDVPDGFVPHDGRLLLHFGAVDQTCVVRVDEVEVGRNEGGYLPFTCDVTEALRRGHGHGELVVDVRDLSDGHQHASGKQRLHRGGIWYTAQSGIWQTVWLEAVPRVHVERLTLVPHLDDGCVEVTVHASQPRHRTGPPRRPRGRRRGRLPCPGPRRRRPAVDARRPAPVRRGGHAGRGPGDVVRRDALLRRGPRRARHAAAAAERDAVPPGRRARPGLLARRAADGPVRRRAGARHHDDEGPRVHAAAQAPQGRAAAVVPPLRPARDAGVAGPAQRWRRLPHRRGDLAGSLPDPPRRHPPARPDGTGRRRRARAVRARAAPHRRAAGRRGLADGVGAVQRGLGPVRRPPRRRRPRARSTRHASSTTPAAGTTRGAATCAACTPTAPGSGCRGAATTGPSCSRSTAATSCASPATSTTTRSRSGTAPSRRPRTWRGRSPRCTSGSRRWCPTGSAAPSTPSSATSRTRSTGC